MATHTIGYDANGNVGDYSTIASFLADLGTNVVSGDTAHVMYADPEKSPYWRESFGRVDANHFNVDVLYDSVCFLHPGGTEFYAVRYDLGGETITVKNVRLIGGGTLLENYALTNGMLIAENCISISSSSHAFYGRVSSNLMICRNCLAVSPVYSGFYMTAANRCTVIDGASRGFRYGSADHCLSICYGANICFESVSPKLYCVSNDATAGTSDGCISNYDYSTLKMQIDNNIRNPFDFRLRPDSDLIGVGGTIDSDVSHDIDGQTRTTPDTPGFSIGVYLEESTDPGESNVLAPTAYKINGVDKTGTYSPDFPDAANVIEGDTTNGAPGTYHEATPAEVQLGVTFGPSETYTGTYDPAGNAPAAPSITSVTASDTQVTLTIDAADAADVVYARYRYLQSDGTWTAWSAESETFKRTGDGDITITSLTNDTLYQFAVYAKSGNLTSDWSVPAYATPTDGANAPAGPMSLPLDHLRTLLANTAEFQSWVNAGSADEAKQSIHLIALDGDDVSAARPYALIIWGSEFNATKVASGAVNTFIQAGGLALYFEDTVPSAYQDDDHHEDAAINFTNRVGQVCDDMQNLAGSDQYLNITTIKLLEGPFRVQKDARNNQGDFMGVWLDVQWRS